MKKLLVLLTLVSNLTFAQTQEVNNSEGGDFNTFFAGDYNKGGLWIPGGVKNNEIKGSTYLFPNWNGNFTITTTIGQNRKIFNINYNIKTKKIESFISKDSVFQYDIENFDVISTNNKNYKVINNGQLRGLYQEIVLSEKLSIYKEIVISVQEAVTNPLTQQDINESTYVKKEVYHFFMNDAFISKKLNKRNVLDFLKDKKVEVKDFASKNNLDFSKEEDVKKIIIYYNTL